MSRDRERSEISPVTQLTLTPTGNSLPNLLLRTVKDLYLSLLSLFNFGRCKLANCVQSNHSFHLSLPSTINHPPQRTSSGGCKRSNILCDPDSSCQWRGIETYSFFLCPTMVTIRGSKSHNSCIRESKCTSYAVLPNGSSWYRVLRLGRCQ